MEPSLYAVNWKPDHKFGDTSFIVKWIKENNQPKTPESINRKAVVFHDDKARLQLSLDKLDKNFKLTKKFFLLIISNSLEEMQWTV